MKNLFSAFINRMTSSNLNKRQWLLLLIFCSSFIGKNYAQAPNWIWANSAGGNGNDDGATVTVDGSGNSYLTGDFTSSSITFGSTTLTNAGSNDMFIVKYDASGNVLWAKKAGGTGIDQARSIAVDGSGNSYVTGFFASSSITFGSTTLTNAGPSNYFDIFVVKYDPSGNVLWAKREGGTGTDDGFGIAVDGSGSSYVTGRFMSGSIIFGSTTLTNGGDQDIFVVKYDSSGNVVWAKGAGGAAADFGFGIAVDGSGNSYVMGRFYSSSIIFGSTTLTNVGNQDVFVVKYDPSGNVLWAKSAGGTGQDIGFGIAVDGGGNSYVTGGFLSSSISFGSTTLTNAGSEDIFVVKYDPSGNVLWAKNEGGTGSDRGYSIAIDGSGSSYVTGRFYSSSISFGSAMLTNMGGMDIFAVKYDPSGNVLWAKSAGGTGGDIGFGIAVDGSGSSYLMGYFESPSISFGSIALTNAGFSDIFIAKLGSGCTAAPLQPGTISGIAAPCSGSSQTYSVAAVTGALTYTWTLPTGWTGTSTTNSIIATASATGGNITVAAVNGCGTSTAQTFAVTVSPGTSATITAAGSTTFCAGGSVTLNANTGAGYTYQWKANGTNITGATNASYTANASGSYTVVVSNTSCSSTSVATIVTVNTVPTPSITKTGFTLSTTAGQGTYQWYKNSAPIAGATNNSYTVIQNGTYYVMVTSSNNCSGQSNSINITNVSIKGPKKRELVIYPTRNNGSFIVRLPEQALPSSLKIINMQGQRVKAEVTNLQDGKVLVNIDDNAPGIYLAELIYPDALYCERIIVY